MKHDRRVLPCPHCGEPVPEDAPSCPHCGSDAETGWDPEAEYNSIELPEEDNDAEAPGAERPGISGAFMALLVIVASLGIIAAGGLLGLAASLFTLLGVLVIIAYIARRMRRPRRWPPVR
ncbi:MAG TPA: hypothetical protein DCM87_01910 [Planctomycetes bacterium]|nr:hypothetical protein [Planctomycetota bacterium]